MFPRTEMHLASYISGKNIKSNILRLFTRGQKNANSA
jgi:hypothetical protein